MLDAGALIALEQNNRTAWVRLKDQIRSEQIPVTHGGVIAQVWRDPSGRQAQLARALKQIVIAPLDGDLGKAAGTLLQTSGESDVVDAAIVALAIHGDVIVTSDPDDIGRLIAAADRPIGILSC